MTALSDRKLAYPIIGITGRARAGKDTIAYMAARHLAKYRRTSTVLALATPLKQLCFDVYGPAYNVSKEAFFGTQEQKEAEIDALPGWTGRKILQHVGTEGFRTISPEVWGRYLIGRAMAELYSRQDSHVILVSDVRFSDEAALIQGIGGIVVKVVRPSVEAAAAQTFTGIANHASEANFDEISPDYLLNNFDRSLDDLDALVQHMLEFYGLVPKLASDESSGV